MKKLGFALAGITAMLILSGQANATVCSSTFMMPTGDGNESFSALGAGVCVQAGDKLFNNFNFGNLPKANSTVTFDLEVLGGTENDKITFTDSFSSGPYTGFGYDVATTPSGNPIVALKADLTQTQGVATLMETTTPAGVGSIDVVKTDNTPSGPFVINYSPGVPSLAVTESLAVGTNSDVSAILNTVVQDVALPEQASLGLLGAALVGFGAIRRRGKAT